MALKLVFIDGARKGEEVIINDSLTIGRKTADVKLQDPKVSSKHAKITKNENGDPVIEDLGSSNGTYVNDVKIKTWTLKAGDKISIGKNLIQVEEVPVLEETIKPKTWQEIIEETLSTDSLLGNKDFGPFQSPITLEFEKGVQAGQKIVFGFGPRSIGKFCVDGFLLDPKSPDVAFELVPSKNSLCEIRGMIKDLKVNGKNQTHEKLQNGDRISFGQTVIVLKANEDGS